MECSSSGLWGQGSRGGNVCNLKEERVWWAGKTFRLRHHSDTCARKRAQGSQIQQQEPLIMTEIQQSFGHSGRELQSIETCFEEAPLGRMAKHKNIAMPSHWLRTSQEDCCLCSKKNEDAEALSANCIPGKWTGSCFLKADMSREPPWLPHKVSWSKWGDLTI